MQLTICHFVQNSKEFGQSPEIFLITLSKKRGNLDNLPAFSLHFVQISGEFGHLKVFFS